MTKISVVILLQFMIVFVAVESRVIGQTTNDDFLDTRITITFEQQPLGKVLGHLINKYDVLIGFEESALDRQHYDYMFVPNRAYTAPANDKTPPDKPGEFEGFVSITIEPGFSAKSHLITVNETNATLKEVLDKIVNQMVFYDWEINDGVVNIFPKEGRDPRSEDLLNLRLSNFSMDENQAVRSIRTYLYLLPEVQAFLKKNGILDRPSGISTWYSKKPLSKELHFTDLTLRELLNKITRVKRGGWILKIEDSESKPGKEMFLVDI